MIEKRKKLNLNPIDTEYSQVDVESYNPKKIPNRYKYLYILVIMIVVIYIYHNISTDSDIDHSKKSFTNSSSYNKLPKYVIKQLNYPKNNNNLVHINNNLKPKLADVTPDYGNEIITSNSNPTIQHNDKHIIILNNNQNKVDNKVDNIQNQKTDIESIQLNVNNQITKIRNMKYNQHIIIETNQEAKQEVKILQEQLRTLLSLLYTNNKQPYQVEMKIIFPVSMKDTELPQEESIFIDLAPISLVPYSVYYFLEIIKNWKVSSILI